MVLTDIQFGLILDSILEELEYDEVGGVFYLPNSVTERVREYIEDVLEEV